MRLPSRLNDEDWLLLGYLFGFLLAFAIEHLTNTRAETTPTNGYGSVLTERALERLEAGEQIKISRWHGGDLLLSGDVVVTVPTEQISDDQEASDDE